MSPGIFITFEGTEGAGKTTQIHLLADRLRASGYAVRTLREPGGTPIGEEIRHLLKHSDANHAMTPEAELLLMSASRAQLVREFVRPALLRGEIVLCDRFYDSTTAYQGFGRGLPIGDIGEITRFAVGETRPCLTFLLRVPLNVSEDRRIARQGQQPARRDRMEEADQAFFERVEQGFDAIANQEPHRVKVVDASKTAEAVAECVWQQVSQLLER